MLVCSILLQIIIASYTKPELNALKTEITELKEQNRKLTTHFQLTQELYEQRVMEVWAALPSSERTPGYGLVVRKDLLDRETAIWARGQFHTKLDDLEREAQVGKYYPWSSIRWPILPDLTYMAVATSEGYMRLGLFNEDVQRLEKYLEGLSVPDRLAPGDHRLDLQEAKRIASPRLLN